MDLFSAVNPFNRTHGPTQTVENITDSIGKEVAYVCLTETQPCIRYYEQGILVNVDLGRKVIAVTPIEYSGIDYESIYKGVPLERVVKQESRIMRLDWRYPACKFMALYEPSADYQEKHRHIGEWISRDLDQRLKEDPVLLILHEMCLDPTIHPENILVYCEGMIAPHQMSQFRVIPRDELLTNVRAYQPPPSHLS